MLGMSRICSGTGCQKLHIIAKAMMGRVSAEIRHREPGQLETGTEGRAEHGPGAARLRDAGFLGRDGCARHSARVCQYPVRPAPVRDG